MIKLRPIRFSKRSAVILSSWSTENHPLEETKKIAQIFSFYKSALLINVVNVNENTTSSSYFTEISKYLHYIVCIDKHNILTLCNSQTSIFATPSLVFCRCITCTQVSCDAYAIYIALFPFSETLS